MVSVGTINGGEVVGASPSLKCQLFRVLSTFDALFEVVFKTVPVYNMDVGVCFTEVSVWPDSDVFIIWISFNFIVGAAGEGICMICSPWFIFK
jgi:hypothetical protein